MNRGLSGKTVLVTGANRGIGLAIALACADAGAHVITAARTAEASRAACEAVRAAGGSAREIVLDVRRAADWERVGRDIREVEGVLHGAVNNAGVSGETAVNVVDTAEWAIDEVLAVNVKGLLLAMRAQIPLLLHSGGGAIVNLASVGGLVGYDGLAPYVASKHAIVGATKAAALECARSGIRVNALAPGGIGTEMLLEWIADPAVRAPFEARIPMGRIGDPHEVAALAVWLLSDAASYVTGAVMPVDGGYTAA